MLPFVHCSDGLLVGAVQMEVARSILFFCQSYRSPDYVLSHSIHVYWWTIQVYAVASHCGKLKQSLLITAPGFEGDFQEALGSTYVFFSSAGTPVLFPIDQNTGGAVEAVSPQNTAWCLGIRDVETWPAEISKLLEGDYDHLDLQGSNRRYGRRFRQQLQLSAHLAEWATAAVDMAACASKRSTEKAN